MRYLLLFAPLCLCGCFGGPSGTTIAANDTGTPLSQDLHEQVAPRVSRLQAGDIFTPQPPPRKPELAPPPLAPPVGVSAPNQYKIRVRAWVNGKPIFEDEVFQMMSPAAINAVNSLPEQQRAEKMQEIIDKQLDHLIDQELMYQDAMKKLEKNNPKALEKIKKFVRQEYEKRLRRIRETNNVPEDKLRDLAKILERQIERDFIATEYMRSRVFPLLQHAVGPKEIKEYYDQHQNEFMDLEKVRWQDVFIALGPRFPTSAHARRFAEDLIAQCRTSDDFNQLIKYDDGDSKFRKGEGFGSRRGEIRPAEVEKYLFELKEGQIGPVVEISTGVHIIRLLEYKPGGLKPFSEDIQQQIRSKLRNEIAEREIKRLVRELRSRAVIEIEPDGV